MFCSTITCYQFFWKVRNRKREWEKEERTENKRGITVEKREKIEKKIKVIKD